jgi:P63C domain
MTEEIITAKKLPRATHEGTLHIGDKEIRCAVLEDGQRVLTQSDVMRALGRARQAKGRQYYDADVNMPAFLTAKNLKPFIPKDLEVTSSQIEFKPLKGARAFGYPADLLPKICGVFIDAKEADVLARTQIPIAEQCKTLLRGFATVGITALVDEATGYQQVRDKQALQAILDAFLRKELAAWAKRFPDEFYEQLFRLRNWQWRGMKVNRPSVVGKYTNDLVYERLAPELLTELEKLNPRTDKGSRRAKHHQWLTEDVGHPALAQHLYATIGFMRASSTWEQFYRMMQRAFPKKNTTMLLPMGEIGV